MRVIVLIALAGCAQLFGLDETTGSDVAALDITRVSIGSTVTSGPQSLAGQTASFLVPDGSDPSGFRSVAATAVDNEWSAPVAGTPPILFTLPSFAGLLAIEARHVSFPFTVLEHPGSAPGSMTAMFQVQGTLPSGYAAGESLRLFVAGSWIVHGLPPPLVGSTAVNTAQFALADADSPFGPRQKIATADAVLFLRYDATSTLTAAGEVPGFAEADTVNTVIFPSGNVSGAIAAFPHDIAISVPVAPAGIATRLAATQPPPATAPSMPWAVIAAPGADDGVLAGPTLESGAVAMTDTMLAATFGNPFTTHTWPSTFIWNTSATRTYTPPGQLPVTLASGLFQIAAATPSLALDLPAGLPTSITIDTTALTTDGLTVAFDPSATAEVSFVADRMANTLYQLQVLRLVPNPAGTALVFEDRLDVLATTPPFQIPANVFKTGELYTLRVTCFQGGFPALSSGDLTMRNLPIAGGSLDSGVFAAM